MLSGGASAAPSPWDRDYRRPKGRKDRNYNGLDVVASMGISAIAPSPNATPVGGPTRRSRWSSVDSLRYAVRRLRDAAQLPCTSFRAAAFRAESPLRVVSGVTYVPTVPVTLYRPVGAASFLVVKPSRTKSPSIDNLGGSK